LECGGAMRPVLSCGVTACCQGVLGVEFNVRHFSVQYDSVVNYDVEY
jgi:hypothetical protein